MSEAHLDLACELMAQSLAAWHVAGAVERSRDGAIVICGAGKEIRIKDLALLTARLTGYEGKSFGTQRNLTGNRGGHSM